MSASILERLFVLGGTVNIVGVLIVSKCFNNPVLTNANPDVFNNVSLACIVLWGLVYLGAARTLKNGLAPHNSFLYCVLSLEKVWYSLLWVQWIVGLDNGFIAAVNALLEEDFLAGSSNICPLSYCRMLCQFSNLNGRFCPVVVLSPLPSAIPPSRFLSRYIWSQ